MLAISTPSTISTFHLARIPLHSDHSWGSSSVPGRMPIFYLSGFVAFLRLRKNSPRFGTGISAPVFVFCFGSGFAGGCSLSLMVVRLADATGVHFLRRPQRRGEPHHS